MTADALVRQHADLVFRVALRVTGNEADAADAAQDALVKVWKGGLTVAESRRRAWCARVSRNAALDLLRRRAVRPAPLRGEMAEPAADASPWDSGFVAPDAQAEASDIGREIRSALDGLDEPYRSIVVLREIEEMSYAEIAETLDLPLNTLKVYLHRARRTLRETIRTAAPDLVP